jgi:hypothetical protein
MSEILHIPPNNIDLLSQMAQDPEIQTELAAIDWEFAIAQIDGLSPEKL